MMGLEAAREMVTALRAQVADIERVIEKVVAGADKAGMMSEHGEACGDYGIMLEALRLYRSQTEDRIHKLEVEAFKETEDLLSELLDGKGGNDGYTNG